MGVAGVGGNNYYQKDATKTYGAKPDDKTDNTQNNVPDAANPEDSFVKSSDTTTQKEVTYKPDRAKLAELRIKDRAYVNQLQTLVSSLLNQVGKQSQADGAASWVAGAGGLDASRVDSYWDLMVDNGDGTFSFNPELSEDAKTALIAKAQEDIGENGYYGVKQTSQRILDFAKAITGGDPSKIQEMREMAQKAFDSVKELMGGVLPEISQKTYDAVMAGFDEWEAEAAAANATATE